MLEIFMKNLGTIAGITVLALLISIASWVGVWGELATTISQSGGTGSKAAGNVMRFLGFMSLPVAILGAAPTVLWIYLRNQGSGGGS